MVTISTTNASNKIHVSNNGAKYYGDLAKGYRDEAVAAANSAQASATSASVYAATTAATATQALSDLVNTKFVLTKSGIFSFL